MYTPLILSAPGIDQSSLQACKRIETAVVSRFPGRQLLWGYNARTVKRATGQGRTDIRRPLDLLRELADSDHRAAVVQSLHLLPGHEFHELLLEVRQQKTIHCAMGMPLFSSIADYQTLIELLTALASRTDPEQALLLIGHGTRHPIWTAYLALEHLLQSHFGPKAFVGVLEHQPPGDDLALRIRGAGYKRVLLVPFLFSAGIHLRRDVLGDGEDSCRSQLVRAGLEVEAVEAGIGMLPGLEQLVVSHIEAADATI